MPSNWGILRRLGGQGDRFSEAGRCRHRPPRQDLRKVAAILGVRVAVGDGFGALGGVFGRRPDQFFIRRLTDERLLDAARADRHRRHVGQRDPGLSDHAAADLDRCGYRHNRPGLRRPG